MGAEVIRLFHVVDVDTVGSAKSIDTIFSGIYSDGTGCSGTYLAAPYTE